MKGIGPYLIAAAAVLVFIPTPGQETRRVSVSSSGGQASQDCRDEDVSDDGRYAVFTSRDNTLVPGDVYDWSEDCFLHDVVTGATEMVSDLALTGSCRDPAISSDGNVIAYATDDQLSPLDLNLNGLDIYVRVRESGQVQLVSLLPDGTSSGGGCGHPALSDDGRYVVFHSYAELVPRDRNDVFDVFRYDRITGETIRLSLTHRGRDPNADAMAPEISGDGRFVVYASRATNITPVEPAGEWDLYLVNADTGVTKMLTTSPTGEPGRYPNGSNVPRFDLSLDGRWIVFSSEADNLVADDTNDREDIFLHDQATGSTVRLNLLPNGEQTAMASRAPGISGDGRWISFASLSAALVPGDPNDDWDTFVLDRDSGRIERVTTGQAGSGISGGGAGQISASGDTVAFSSSATDLVPDDTNSSRDVFLTGSLAIVSDLRIARNANGTLGLSWTAGSAADTGYNVYEGSLEALSGGQYDHHLVPGGCGITEPFLDLVPAGFSTYLVVSALNPVGEGSPGRDSDGARRPVGDGDCVP